eukprot:5922125-Prymnesium_polylepis.1
MAVIGRVLPVEEAPDIAGLAVDVRCEGVERKEVSIRERAVSVDQTVGAVLCDELQPVAHVAGK